MSKILKVDVDLLISKGLKIEEFLLLYGIVKNDKVLIEDYTDKCAKFPSASFKRLKDKGYLDFKDKEQIAFKDLKALAPAFDLFGLSVSLSFDQALLELRELYPSKVPDGKGSYRRLHGDPERIRRLYKELIGDKVVDQNLHELIKKCVILYHREHLRGGRTSYMQMLAVWLNQKTYEQYMEDAKKQVTIETNNRTNETSI